MISCTAVWSSMVERSPSWLPFPSTIFRSTRRMIFPERVLGKRLTTWKQEPLLMPVRGLSKQPVPAFKVTNHVFLELRRNQAYCRWWLAISDYSGFKQPWSQRVELPQAEMKRPFVVYILGKAYVCTLSVPLRTCIPVYQSILLKWLQLNKTSWVQFHPLTEMNRIPNPVQAT